MFDAEAIDEVGGIFDASISAGDSAHRWIVAERDEALVGGAYVALEAVSDKVWNLLMIAVRPGEQGSGVGAMMVADVVAWITSAGGRILLVETSSTDQFDRTRKFYTDLGFVEEARIRGYYGPGDDKVVFWKSLSA